MSLLKRLFSRKSETVAATFTAKPAPARLLYVLGDIHGRDDLLEQSLGIIDADAGDQPHDLVLVGDYVDRGDESAAVLNRLQVLSTQAHVTCIMGNHERMLLDFIENPAEKGRRWIRNGGLQTLASFGVGGITETSAPELMTAARYAFVEKLGPLKGWLENLPLSFQSGNIFTTHAAANPSKSIPDQTDNTMLWGHPAFFRDVRQDGTWIAHGHYVVEEAADQQGRISVDTGAYATGRLTTAKIETGSVLFFSTG